MRKLSDAETEETVVFDIQDINDGLVAERKPLGWKDEGRNRPVGG